MTVNGQPSGRAGDHPAALFESYSEYEVFAAPRTVTPHLFHYTNTEAAVTGILASGTLRLSPYKSTNDLWESQPHYPTLSAHHDQEGLDAGFDLWDEIDWHLRLHTKVGCLTQDIALPSEVFHRDALRGWAHLSLWAHYGAAHTGVCLKFDRDRLIASFLKHARPSVLAFHGPVLYLRGQDSPATGIDLGQVEEFGVDAVAIAYAEANKDQLFFRKHIDWDSESEYRLILLNESIDFDYVDIRDALTGIVLGSAFPEDSVPDLLKALEPYPGVTVEHVRFHNRRLNCFPFEGFVGRPRQVTHRTWPAPKREGPLPGRLQALREAEAKAVAQKAAATLLAEEHVTALARGIEMLTADLRRWPGTQANSHRHSMAIPPEKRMRSAGVAGEVIHYQQGFMCVVENLPLYTHTLVVAAAIQVLDNQRLRFHAVVTTEQWHPDGNTCTEHWRGQRETSANDAYEAVTAILRQLATEVCAFRSVFDQARGVP
ncbi:DUF2971 domain-containing protein [Streptomyces sp. ISL-99]|uniref:DUF2971 domain-containing protein n=1 Tax=Streptomyces sp. ISL-99 TaxID=2819193 RepID=UPI001BE92CBA|nr:DUF2971 domain-containing protein [Streptomyces sp. ISL-99]MBT2525653.1 DUF2971 domain-containing protein [Streptomyces sp. ISL-99]